MKTLLFYVQHLLGIGHVRRALLIVHALQARGVQVHLVLGGRPQLPMDLSQVHVHWLPPLHSDAQFSALLNAQNQRASEDELAARRQQLLSLAEALACDALMVEMYPLGRRAFGFELEPLIQQHRDRGAPCFLSCRDILVRKTGDKARAKRARYAQQAARLYDDILIHGDPQFIAFEDSFDQVEQLGDKVVYTGLVAPPPMPAASRRNEILVSAGGGAVGEQLLDTALDACAAGFAADAQWRLIGGPNLPAASAERLAERARELSVQWQTHCRDLPQQLASTRVSVSQAGYNTVCDLLSSRTPAVLVPFAEQEENEQQLRAERLAALGRVQTLAPQALSAEPLGRAVERAAEQPVPSLSLHLDGAQRSADIVWQRLHP